MRDPIGDVPRAYAVHRVGSTWLVFDRAHLNSLVELRLADPKTREQLFAGAPQRGRGAAPTVALSDGTRMVLRRYQHGGLLAALTGPLFLGPQRPLQELRVTARAEDSGAPVPHVLCLVLWPIAGPFWSAMIGTREEQRADDLLRAIQTRVERGEERGLVALARKVGSAIRKLHDAGVEHRDLQLRNILVAPTPAAPHESRIVVVDLDRAVFHPLGLVPVGRRARNLGRLARSAFKAGLWGSALDRRHLAAFSRAYTGSDRRLRHDLRAHIPAERAKLWWHRLSYRLRGHPT